MGRLSDDFLTELIHWPEDQPLDEFARRDLELLIDELRELRAAQRWKGVVDEIRAAVVARAFDHLPPSEYRSGWSNCRNGIEGEIDRIIAKHAAKEDGPCA